LRGIALIESILHKPGGKAFLDSLKPVYGYLAQSTEKYRSIHGSQPADADYALDFQT
jgi:hypothetical protein